MRIERHIFCLCLAGCLAGYTFGQSANANPFDGTWRGSFGDDARINAIELVIAGSEGSVMMQGLSRNNPCLNRPLPVVVERFTADELFLQVQGSKVLAGCADRPSHFKRTSSTTMISDLGATLELQK
jgi:hypothetical protein